MKLCSYISLYSTSRESRILGYLILTTLIMILEFAYGYFSNSLGLISDSFHMLLDAVSLVVGLVATAISVKSPNSANPFGYCRYEVLCSFINGVLLVFIAFYVMVEAIGRLLSSPEIEGPYLFLVAFIGLMVNVIGVVFFHDTHGCSHDHNMRGIYLHILADLLGSISVLLSSWAISYGYWVADPICSAACSILIFLSAIPLILETGKILLLAGDSATSSTDLLYNEINKLGCVTDLQTPLLWTHSTSPQYLSFCIVSAKLRSGVGYIKCKNDIINTVESMFSKRIGTNVRVIVHLEK